MEQVTLVDESGRVIGAAEKLAAHRGEGQWHLAFSIFIVDPSGAHTLLQRRADEKYHFAGRWSNACCGHPRPDETVDDAAHRRLEEEFGFVVPLHEVAITRYEATDPESALTERELLHILVGTWDGEPDPNPREIGAWEWCDLETLPNDVRTRPGRYSPWFTIVLEAAVAAM